MENDFEFKVIVKNNNVKIADDKSSNSYDCSTKDDVISRVSSYVESKWKSENKEAVSGVVLKSISESFSKPTYIDFGKNISGYLYVGKNVKSPSPIVVIEEGSSMHVLKYGVGKDLSNGKCAGYEDCIIWLHDRRSSIQAGDVVASTKKIVSYLGGAVSGVYAMGFSNGAASVTGAVVKEPSLFKAVVSSGGNATGLPMSGATKLLFFCSCKGLHSNLDTIGRFVVKGRANTQAYLYNTTHSDLEKITMTDTVMNYLVGSWKFGFDGQTLTANGRCNGKYYYEGVKKL